jgi:LacI family transcriptional regulator
VWLSLFGAYSSTIPRERALPATIRDVAKLAGCSIKTVSRVINDEPYVTEETRAKVNTAIRAVGYAPNISARRLAQNKSYMICLLMYPGYYQQGSELLTRIMDIGYEENYDILIQPYFPLHSRSKRKLVNLIYEHRIDGFVTTPPLDADEFVADMLSTYKVPQVQITPYHLDESLPHIAGEDYQGAYAMTEYLIQLGHRRIAFFKGPRNMRASKDRANGYAAALAAAGLEYDDDLVRNSEWTFDGGYTLTKLLREIAEPPSAIFAGNDQAAYGVIYAAQELGLQVPGDLSVSGYDDLALSNNIWPGLTTVHQPSDEMFERATRLLIGMLKGQAAPQTITIPSRLVIRGSTGAPSCTM